MKKDKISIVVPCYNEEESLPIFYKEINRISKEMSECDFELLFINDGSRDKTLSILRDMAKKDKRVRYISFSRNFGKEAGMWAGLENAKGDYIALMDADDLAVPERFEKQIEYLGAHPELSIVGGNIHEFINTPDNCVGKRIVPQTDDEIKEYMKRRCPMNQMTVMFKKKDVAAVG